MCRKEKKTEIGHKNCKQSVLGFCIVLFAARNEFYVIVQIQKCYPRVMISSSFEMLNGQWIRSFKLKTIDPTLAPLFLPMVENGYGGRRALAAPEYGVVVGKVENNGRFHRTLLVNKHKIYESVADVMMW